MLVSIGGPLLIRSADAMIANFRQADAIAQRQYRTAVRRHAEDVVRLTRIYCPVDTGWMRDHVRFTLSPSGLISQIGWWQEDFLPFGKPFYPPYQEFGTRFLPGQPSLYPAFLLAAPAFTRELQGITVRSVRRLGRVRRARAA